MWLLVNGFQLKRLTRPRRLSAMQEEPSRVIRSARCLAFCRLPRRRSIVRLGVSRPWQLVLGGERSHRASRLE
jgi:hypothetical protein